MIEIREMRIEDYEEVYLLWQRSDGIEVCTRGSDSMENIARYLERNPGCSYVAFDGGILVGIALAGHDGKRGLIHHTAVEVKYRGQGIGRELVERCMEGIRAAGIPKCYILVVRADNESRGFWERTGWDLRTELVLMSKYT